MSILVTSYPNLSTVLDISKQCPYRPGRVSHLAHFGTYMNKYGHLFSGRFNFLRETRLAWKQSTFYITKQSDYIYL
jgi:hypothetical protein